MSSITIPVKLSDSFEGLAESSGLLIFIDDKLKIQFETRDAFLGLLKSGVREVELPLLHITQIEVKKGLVSAKILLEVDDLKVLELLPGTRDNQLLLKIARKDKQLALDLIRAIRLDMSEREYAEALKNAS